MTQHTNPHPNSENQESEEAKYVQVPLSACHRAPMRVHSGDEGTNYYICTQCGEPCDQYVEPPAKLTTYSPQPPTPAPNTPIESDELRVKVRLALNIIMFPTAKLLTERQEAELNEATDCIMEIFVPKATDKTVTTPSAQDVGHCLDIHCTNKNHYHAWSSSIELVKPPVVQGEDWLEKLLDEYMPVDHRDDDNFTCKHQYYECSYKSSRVDGKTMRRFAGGVYCIATSYYQSNDKECSHPQEYWKRGKCNCGASKERRKAKAAIQAHIDAAHKAGYNDGVLVGEANLGGLYTKAQVDEAVRKGLIAENNRNYVLHVPNDASDEYQRGFDDAVDQYCKAFNIRAEQLTNQSKGSKEGE